METQTPLKSVTPAAGAKGYIVLPPEAEPPPFLSAKLIAFAVVIFAIATVAGLARSGRIQISGFSPKPVADAAAPDGTATSDSADVPAPAAGPATPQKPVSLISSVTNAVQAVVAKPTPPPPTLPAGTFTVTSVSLGNPSFAIINGQSKTVGDAVSANGVTGWSVGQITESTVVLRNGAGVAELAITAPGLNPLNDKLNPLN